MPQDPRPLPVPSLPDALERFEEIVRGLRERRPAIFLDYDGTLTPIVARPELACLSDAMRETLGRLADRFPVAVVSGRDRGEVERLVGLEGLYYAGSHGFDIAGPGSYRFVPEAATAAAASLAEATEELRARLGAVPGVLVERKRFAVALHYRQVASADLETVRAAFLETAARHRDLRTTEGKKVFELRPDLDWDKGRAVTAILEHLERTGRGGVPLYLGDDLTDEDAFAAIGSLGIGIVVGGTSHPTLARYRLRDVGAVEGFLRRVAELPEAPRA
jgi:alpha,alpha-trehalase